jgi:hypothetical protein
MKYYGHCPGLRERNKINAKALLPPRALLNKQ